MSETSLVQTAKGPASAEKSEALSSLMYATNRDDETTRALCDEGLLTALMNIEKNFPPTNKCWDDDSAPEGSREDWWLAFDVLTNICKWKSCRDDVIKAGVVEFLAPLALKENYFGFEATEGLAYVVGRDEHGKNSKLLQGRPKNVAKIIEVLDSTLNGNGSFFGMGFSTYGRVLAVQSLSVSDANKPMLKPAIPLMVQVIERGEERCLPLALQFLLEMTFVDEILDYTRTVPGIKDVLANVQTSDKETKKLNEALIYRLDEHTRNEKAAAARRVSMAAGTTTSTAAAATAAPQPPGGHVMMSYCWKQQLLIKQLVPMLKAAGLSVWFDLEQMDGKDTIEAMAEAVEGCSFFILAASSDYRESANCRLEATYAGKHRKTICPLIVEAGYVPNGWLGILTGEFKSIDMYTPELVGTAITAIVPLAHAAGVAPPSVPITGQPHRNVAATTTPSSSKPVTKKLVLPPVIANMTPQQVDEFIGTKCGLGKTAVSYAKKAGVSGKTLAIAWYSYAHHVRSGKTGSVVENLSKWLGTSSVVPAYTLLYEMKMLVIGGASKAATMMTVEQVQEFISTKCGLSKTALTSVKKENLDGRALSAMWDHYSRGGSVVESLSKILGGASIVATYDVLYELGGVFGG